MQQNLMLQIGSTIYLPSLQGSQRKFKVIKQLGQSVYKVKPLDKNFYVNDVVIKIQHMATENEIKFIDLLIDHQNKENQMSQDYRSQIIRIYERTQYEGNLVTIMELGESDLYSILQNKGVFQTINDKIKILNQMAQSISFLHHNQFIHRDLKPEHYLKVGDEFKLIDFGLVKFNQQYIKTSNIGTNLFQAPEIKERSNNYTEAVDIWSLGGTFYEILTESQFICDNLNISTIEIKVPQSSFVNQQILNLIKTLLNGMLQINSSSRLKINEVKQQLTNIQNLIQQPQQIIPNNFQQNFTVPYLPKPQLLPNQPNQIQNQILAQNVFPLQKQDIEKKMTETVAAPLSDQNSQLKYLIMDMRDLFVERFHQQQKQIQNFNNSLIENIEKNLKENLQKYMQDLNKKVELSIKENIQSQFEKIQKATPQQNQIIQKKEESLNGQTQQYQSLIKDIQQSISNLTQHQNGYLNNLNQNLDKNWQKLTNYISEFKILVQNQQQVKKQMLEQKEIKRLNFMQQFNEKFQDLNQLIISQLKDLKQQKSMIEIQFNEIQKQLIKNLSSPQDQNQANKISYNAQPESNDKQQINLMDNQHQSRFDKDKNQNIQELQQQGGQKIRPSSCPKKTKRFGVI